MIKITELAHRQVAEALHGGGRCLAVDATAGGGRDTLFLARLVGPGGHVYTFDIQQEALDQTAALLKQACLTDRVTLVRAGHERMAEYIENAVSAVVFNLGYLPGGDKSIATSSETTLIALRQALHLLRPGGIVTVIAYPGHALGKIEREAVFEFCRSLHSNTYAVSHLTLINREYEPPELFSITKY
ncbi:MAG: class I SAM-dependent methyltransferase [Bacillota bacterium]